MSPDKFIHQYFTLKYDAESNNWFTHRYAVEHFRAAGIPDGKTEQFSQKEIGRIPFNKIQNFPDYLYYEPKLSTVFGTLTTKTEYAPPNYGETPEKDEKLTIYILESEVPLNIYPLGYQDRETGDSIKKNVNEIQIIPSNEKFDLKTFINKKIILTGNLISDQSPGIFTKIGMRVHDFLE